jgi:hypothetical protein
MSDDTLHSRRDFIAGTLAVGGALLLSKYESATAMSPAGPEPAQPRLVLFDPESTSACRVASDGASHGCATLPVVGDRVRFARDVFGASAAPAVVAGVTTYADYILLSGCAAEHGYRVLSERLPAAGERFLVEWKVGVRRSTYSG